MMSLSAIAKLDTEMKNNSAYILRKNQYLKQKTLFLRKVVCFVLIITATLFNGSLFAAELEKVLN